MNPQESKPPSKLGKLLKLISEHPLGALIIFLVTFFGGLASIIGLFPTLFPWLVMPKPDLVYCVNPVRTPIVQADSQTHIGVTYDEEPLLGKSVTAVQIALWNRGRESTRSNDILSNPKQLTVHIPSGCNLLETTILTNTRPEIKFWVEADPDFTDGLPISPRERAGRKYTFRLITTNHTIGVGWDILEHNDGALIQIIYEGKPDAPFTVDGTIVGQGKVHAVKPGAHGYLKFFVFVFIMFLASLMTGTIMGRIERELPSIATMIALFAGIFVLVGLGFHYLGPKPLSPFGF